MYLSRPQYLFIASFGYGRQTIQTLVESSYQFN